MNIAGITAKLSTVGGPKVQRLVGKASKYSPQILTGVGLIAGAASTVLIARATLKLDPLLQNHEQGKQIIADRTADKVYLTEKERRKDVTYLYTHTALDLVKLYGPGVSLALGAGVAIVAAQGISQKRQVALVAAIKSLESSFQAYRQRVIEAIGADKEEDIRYGISTETIDIDGKKTKVRKFTGDALDRDEYFAFFDPDNKNWERGGIELNYLFLKNIQNWANDRLDARGYVYLNEVRQWLGLPTTPAGQILGWRHKDLPDAGDGYIDFGWENAVNEQGGKIGDRANGIVLSFNCDGEIMSKL